MTEACPGACFLAADPRGAHLGCYACGSWPWCLSEDTILGCASHIADDMDLKAGGRGLWSHQAFLLLFTTW